METLSSYVPPYEHIFKRINRRIVEIFGAEFNLDYMKLELSDLPRNKDGTICSTFPVNEYGGCWTANKTIYLNPKYLVVMRHYFGDVTFSRNQIDNFTSIITAHELCHEIHARKEFIHFVPRLIDEARNKKFRTVYLEKCKNNDAELFCEYCAYLITRRKTI